MLIVPAIDLKDGRCVRLVRGELGTERTVAPDPVSQARAFEAAGAERIHVVDLDGAFAGRPVNTEIIRAIAGAVRVPVEVGGGLRSSDDVEAILECGASYAILGTMLVEDTDRFREIARRFPGRIIAGIDEKEGLVATKGWVGDSSVTVEHAADVAVAAGACAIVTTDIGRDGTGLGVNVADTHRLAERVSIPVFASGGVSGLVDIERLSKTHVAGVIIGRALYDGLIDLREALRVARG